MTTWTFDPPFPDMYNISLGKKLFIAAEPNGDNDRPERRDMGEWIRNVPKTGTKFYRYLISISASFKCVDVDPRGKIDPVEFLGDWRFLDLVKEEAGSVVTGDFRKRVQNNLLDTLEIITKDAPEFIVLLGDHTQRSFEELVAPHLANTRVKRLGMPHPSSRIGGYISHKLVGDPNEMLKNIHEPMMSYSHRKGWNIFSK